LDFAAVVALFFCGLGAAAVVTLRAGALALAALLAEGAAGFLRVAATLFALGFTACLLFEGAGLLDLVALRAGAFSASERFTIGLGFADLLADGRFFDEAEV
jgi:hypothetical protein